MWKLAPVVFHYLRDRKVLTKADERKINREKIRQHAYKAVNVLIDLGPTFIKIGQVLSTRPDVVPQEYVDELSKLQDQVPPAPFPVIKSQIEEDLGPLDQVFDDFDEEAISGASLGQVYKAVLKEGTPVAVKVNRPNIHTQVKSDLKALRKLAPLFKRVSDESVAFSVESILDEFSVRIFDEMDYRLEAQNLLTIKKNLRHDKKILVPDVYSKYTTKRVLTLEYVPGTKITDIESIKKMGLDPTSLATKIDRTFLKMLLKHDIFHADPHPGNISVKEDGTLILYDFGMVGSLDDKTRKKLVRLYLALADRDPARTVAMLVKLGTLQPNINRYVIQRGIELAIRDLEGIKVEEMELKELMALASKTIFQFPFRLPRYLVLYLRMSTELEGVCRILNPNFNFIRILKVVLEEEGLRREAEKDDLKDIFTRMGQAFEATVDIAPMLKSFLEYSYSDGFSRSGAGFNPQIIPAIISAAILVSAAILSLQNVFYGQIGFLVGAATIALTFLVKRR